MEIRIGIITSMAGRCRVMHIVEEINDMTKQTVPDIFPKSGIYPALSVL